MAIASFTKKIIKNMGVDDKTAVARSTNDIELLFSLMRDKSDTVVKAAKSNRARVSPAGVKHEILELSNGTNGSDGESFNTVLLAYMVRLAGWFPEESTPLLIETLQASGGEELGVKLLASLIQLNDQGSLLLALKAWLTPTISGSETEAELLNNPELVRLLTVGEFKTSDGLMRLLNYFVRIGIPHALAHRAIWTTSRAVIEKQDSTKSNAAISEDLVGTLLVNLDQLKAEVGGRTTEDVKRLLDVAASVGSGYRSSCTKEEFLSCLPFIISKVREIGDSDLFGVYANHWKAAGLTFTELMSALPSKNYGHSRNYGHEAMKALCEMKDPDKHEATETEVLILRRIIVEGRLPSGEAIAADAINPEGRRYIANLMKKGAFSSKEATEAFCSLNRFLTVKDRYGYYSGGGGYYGDRAVIPDAPVLAQILTNLNSVANGQAEGSSKDEQITAERTIPTVRSMLLEMARRQLLSKAHFLVLWDTGLRSIEFYIRDGAEDVAIEHFSSDDLWGAMRRADISRKGVTRYLRHALKKQSEGRTTSGNVAVTGAPSKGQHKVDSEGEGEETDEGDDEAEKLAEEENTRREFSAAKVISNSKTLVPFLELVNQLLESPTKELKNITFMVIQNLGGYNSRLNELCEVVEEVEIDLIKKLMQLEESATFSDEEQRSHYYGGYSRGMIERLVSRQSPKKIFEMLTSGQISLLHIGSTGGAKVFSLETYLKLIQMYPELASPSYIVCGVEKNETDSQLVLGLCRSSVQKERLLGFRLLPRVMSILNPKDISKAILRSSEANKKLNKVVYEVAGVGDELGSGVFLLLSYVKEIYFDHSPVLAADFMDSLLSARSVGTAVLCPPENLHSFISLTHLMSKSPDFLLSLLRDKSKKAAMHASDIGRAYGALAHEHRAVAIDMLRKSYRGDNVFGERAYDVRTLAGLHDALTFIGRRMSEEDYQFANPDSTEFLLALYASNLSTDGVRVQYGEKETEITVRLVSTNHGLIDLGDACGFCIGNGSYAKNARAGEEAHFAIISSEDKPIGACSYGLPNWEMTQIKYSNNRSVPNEVREAIDRAVRSYIEEFNQRDAA